MLITEILKLNIKGLHNLTFYIENGCNITGNYILVPVKLISTTSHIKVEAKCDYCDNICEIVYVNYIKSIKTGGYSCSRKCAVEKRISTNMEKYGGSGYGSSILLSKIRETNLEKYSTEFISQSQEIKDKVKATNLKNYGVANVFQSDVIKDKIRETNLEKYGVEYIMQSSEMRNKVTKTNLEKYGGTGFSSELTKNKIKQSIIEKYGTEFASQNVEIKNKVRETNIERYDVNCVFQSEDIKSKSKETNLNKYGFKYTSQSFEIKKKVETTNLSLYDGFGFGSEIIYDKIKKTNIEKYGTEFPSQNIEIKEKIKLNNLEKYGTNSLPENEEFRTLNYKIAKDPDYISYCGNRISKFKCIEGHYFNIHKDNYYNRIKDDLPLCTICYPIGDASSIKEKELLKFIKSIYFDNIISSYRDGLEIDIYLPGMKIGFEFNGLYWHSNKFKEKNYHLDKTNFFKKRGIKIIHIWEDDWTFRREIIESQIRNMIGLNYKSIFARKCIVKEVSTIDVKSFLNNNHIQGNVSSSIKIGLYSNSELLSIMTFDSLEGRKKMEDGDFNLNRFCNKLNTNVIGGASKLLSYFIKTYKPNRIISYADKNWSVGDLYYKLGFKNIGESIPDYKYIVNNKKVHKSRYRKSKLNTTLTESKQMELNGINKIYDCGKIKFEKTISEK